MTNNSHIRDFLQYYCNLPKGPQYAILLSGLWGSGKTWFIKNHIKNSPQKEKFLYISLYGLQNFDDIESQLFSLIHPLLGSKPARVLGRIFKGVIKTTVNIDFDGDGKSDGNISGGLPTEKLISQISLDPDQIIVFDDLERCSIPVTDLLGYINNFVEHGESKAILIANETELLKNESEVEPRYIRIKEKLIGRSFEIIPEVESALEHFASELPSAQAQEVVRSNFQLIIQIYECSTYKNLRLIRHSLWDFDRILQSIDPSYLKSSALLTDLLALFLTYSLEIRSGSVQPSQINKLQDEWLHLLNHNKNTPDPDQSFHDIQKKYSGLNLYKNLIQESTWEAIFKTGSIPKEELEESISRSKYFIKSNQPNWVKLWHGMDLSDEDFAKILSTTRDEWNNRLYSEIGEIIQITGMFIHFSKKKIHNYPIKKIINTAKTYAKELIEKENPAQKVGIQFSFFERDAYAGLGFYSRDDENFQKFLTYIAEFRAKTSKSSYPKQAQDLLDLIGTDTGLFYRRIILNNDPDNLYYKTPILHLIEPKEFIEKTLKSPPNDQRMISYALKERYSFKDFNNDLCEELNWLRQIKRMLKIEANKRKGKISSLSINGMIEPYINQAIAQLEETKDQMKA